MERIAEANTAAVENHSREIFRQRLARFEVQADHCLSWVLLCQWLLVVGFTYLHAASGASTGVIWVGGAALSVVPIAALLTRRGGLRGSNLRGCGPLPRYTAAAAQVLWALLLAPVGFDPVLHGVLSLALLIAYRDCRLLWAACALACALQAAAALQRETAEAWRVALQGFGYLVAATWVYAVTARLGLHELNAWARCEAILDQTVEAAERQIAARTHDLRASAESFRRLVENISAVPWELERNTGKVVYLAPQFGQVFGVADTAAGRPLFLELFHRDDREPFKTFLGQTGAQRTRAEQFIDSRLMGADNDVVHVRSFVTDRGGDVDAATVYGVTLDITEQKRMEFDLLQAQKLESMGQLSAGIAHEINTPIRYLGQNIRDLQQGVEELVASHPDGRQYGAALDHTIEQALEGVARIAAIVEAMQEFSHPALERAPHDLNRAISSTIVIARNEWKYVADITTDFDAALPLVAVMPGAFNQVILNVLINAAHAVAATLDGNPGSKGRIALTTRRVAEWAEIRVSDSGCGIPEKIKERIFDPFFTTKPVGKGTGQGLAIAHDVIVKKHRGAIWAESESPTGTTFIIRLPLDTGGRNAIAAA